MPLPSDLESSFIIVNNEEDQTVSNYPNVEPYAHHWQGSNLRRHGRHIIDKSGRVCLLRGVNLSGSCKSPVNHVHETFPHAKSVTFVGRPFPLEEADAHFARLRRWGLTFIRFLVTWEAIEHAGPGVYDKEYLNYIRNLLSILPKYGLVAFVSIHQDVWSRYSGGSGAPAWTLEAAGFNLKELESTGAAWLQGLRGGGHSEAERGVWPTGYHKLAAATMATCFWGGNTFTPKLLVKDGTGQSIQIQEYLQNAFLNMFDTLVGTVGDLEAVIGFEMLNEPHPGYINLPSLHSFNYNTDLHLSYIPTAFESFQLGAGHPTRVAEWARSFPMPTKKTGHAVLNPDGKSAWLPNGPTGGSCIWEMHGVWGWDKTKDQGVVLRENYFVKHPMTGEKIDFYTQFFYPFLRRWSDRVRALCPANKLLFVEVIPNEFCPKSFTPEHQPENLVYAPHWYDLRSLFDKAFGDFTVNVQGISRGMFPLKAFYWGQHGARQNFALQIKTIVTSGYQSLGEVPVIVGETGVPMDMNKAEAFETGDFKWQMRMMDAVLCGLERALIGFTLWNYNPRNNDQDGDDWNGENFSWFSGGRALPPSLLYYEQTSVSLDNGGRILPAVVRPYPAKTAGVPVRFEYEMTTGTFVYEWIIPGGSTKGNPPTSGHPPLASNKTLIFVPSLLTSERKLIVKGLGLHDSFKHDESQQTLAIQTKDLTPGKRYKIQVLVYPPLRPEFEVNDFNSDYGGMLMVVIVALVAIFATLLFKML